jgi:hypothetical protein
MPEQTALKPVEITNPKLAKLAKIQEGVGQIVIRLSAVVIKDQETYDVATATLKDAKQLSSDLETAKDEIIKEPNTFVKLAKDTYNAIVGPIDLGTKELKSRMSKYQSDQEAKRQKALYDLEQKKQALQAKAEAADTVKEQVKTVEKIAVVEAKQEVISTFKPKSADKVRKFEVVNPDLVERQYCTPEDKKIRPFIGEVNGPVPNIPGVRIWDEFKIVNR